MTSLNSSILPFVKMQALGNDFIVLDAERLLQNASTEALLNRWHEASPTLARTLSSRRFGVGADGLILAINLEDQRLQAIAHELYGTALDGCQLAWTYTNSDGSSSETCGNGLRCLALWAHARGLFKEHLRICTQAGPMTITFSSPEQITADLGSPSLSAAKIPFAGVAADKQIIGSTFALGDQTFPITCVNMGNPHCLIFSGDFLRQINVDIYFDGREHLSELPSELEGIAKMIQSDARFPESANVSFIVSHGQNSARAIVWERGCGPTMACGSAAAAILVGGVLENRLERESIITLPGGSLSVHWSSQDDHVRICGPAKHVFEGEFRLEDCLLDSFVKTAAVGGAHR